MDFRFLRVLLAALFTLSSTTAYAESDLERFEKLSEAMSAKMNILLVKEMPQVADYLPSTEWDDDYRKAGACMLKKYESLLGEGFLEDMISKGEAFLAREFSGFEDMTTAAADFAPKGLTDQDQVRINQECGMMQLHQKRMMESGFAEPTSRTAIR